MSTLDTPWNQSGRVIAEADTLEELIRLRMERPGVTREQALEWALAMRAIYGPEKSSI
jgi:hypothetical protein